MKYHLVVLCLWAGTACVHSQSNTVASGGNASGSTGSTSFSIGQIDYIQSSSSTGSFNQGVQQPFELFQLNGLSENLEISLTIGPNPSEGSFTLIAEGIDDRRIIISVTDMSGRQVIAFKGLEAHQIIDLQKESAGQYMLNLYSEGQVIGTYKLIKNS